jgi:hypothetical protein
MAPARVTQAVTSTKARRWSRPRARAPRQGLGVRRLALEAEPFYCRPKQGALVVGEGDWPAGHIFARLVKHYGCGRESAGLVYELPKLFVDEPEIVPAHVDGLAVCKSKPHAPSHPGSIPRGAGD